MTMGLEALHIIISFRMYSFGAYLNVFSITFSVGGGANGFHLKRNYSTLMAYRNSRTPPRQRIPFFSSRVNQIL